MRFKDKLVPAGVKTLEEDKHIINVKWNVILTALVKKLSPKNHVDVMETLILQAFIIISRYTYFQLIWVVKNILWICNVDVKLIYLFRMVKELLPLEKDEESDKVTMCAIICKQDVVIAAGTLQEQRMPKKLNSTNTVKV